LRSTGAGLLARLRTGDVAVMYRDRPELRLETVRKGVWRK
jgi:hypothetical protein